MRRVQRRVEDTDMTALARIFCPDGLDVAQLGKMPLLRKKGSEILTLGIATHHETQIGSGPDNSGNP